MGSIGCIQGQAKGIREPLVLIPISKGIPQDVLESFGVQESQEGLQDLHLAPDWEQSTPLFSGEMREFLPAQLGDLDVPHPCSPVPHPSSSLHSGKPNKVTEVEVISLFMVPVLSLLVNPLDQGVSSGIQTCIHGCAVGQPGVCHLRHASYGTLAITTRHIVAVEIVMWHDELGGWKCW